MSIVFFTTLVHSRLHAAYKLVFESDEVKPQVHGSTEVVKREYRSNRELFNSINFY